MPILIVEDDADTAEALALVLEDLGLPSVVARNGIAAIERARSHPRPRAVLLDMALPRARGHDVVECLQAQPDLRSLPIVTMTAMVNAPRPAGVVAHLEKPFAIDDLIAALKAAAVFP